MVARNQSTVCLVWEKGGVPSKLWGPELAMCGPSPVIEVRERDIVGRVSPRVRVFEVNDPFHTTTLEMEDGIPDRNHSSHLGPQSCGWSPNMPRGLGVEECGCCGVFSFCNVG